MYIKQLTSFFLLSLGAITFGHQVYQDEQYLKQSLYFDSTLTPV